MSARPFLLMRHFTLPSARSARVALVLLAGAIGFGVNSYPVMLVGGVLVFFGQIPALACAIAFGPAEGLAAGALAAARYITWGQQLTFAIHVAEALVIGLLSRRWRPLRAAAVFWLVLGTPALLISLLGIRHMALDSAVIAAAKNFVAGMLHVTVASIIVGEALTLRIRDAAPRDSLASALNRRIAALLTVPVLIIVVTLSTVSQSNAESAAFVQLDLEAARHAASVNQYVRGHVRTVATVAAALASGAVTSNATEAQFLRATHAENPGFLTMLIADSTGIVRHAVSGGPSGTPPVSALPAISDRAYFREPMRTGRPFVSSAFMGRGFGRDVIYAISAPIVRGKNRPSGIVEGSLSVAELSAVVSTGTNVDVTLIDDQNHIIFSTVASRWPSLSPLPAYVPLATMPSGRFVLNDASQLTVLRERLYASTKTDRGWTILVERPRYDALSAAAIFGTTLFLASLTIFIVLLAAVRMVNAIVARPLADLAKRTAELDWSAPAPTLGDADADTGPREVAVVSEALLRASSRIADSYSETQRAMAARDAALAEREATLRDLDALVRERTRELEQERDRAQAASRAKSGFLANMSHELRTPLNVILGVGESLAEGVYGDVDEAQAQALGEIDAQGQHLLTLISEVLDFARIESGRVSVQLAPVELTALLGEVVGSFHESARQHGVALQVDAPATVRTILADPLRLRQVLINLIGNALKFTPAGGRIALRLEMKPGSTLPLAVHVADSGMGIPADRLPTIFEAFEQVADSQTRSHAGTGLGLTISRSIAEAMGMSLTVESTLGVGSTFTLHLNRDA